MSASRPRPSAFLCMLQNLPGQLSVTLSPRAVWVVQDNRLSKRGSFTELDVTGDDALVDPIREELPRLVGDLLGQIEPCVEHREQHTLDSESGIEALLDTPDRPEELGEALQCQV